MKTPNPLSIAIAKATLGVSALLVCAQAPVLTAQETADAAPSEKPQATAAAPALSPGVTEIVKMVEAGVAPDIVKNFVAQSKTRYALTAKDLIALKEKKVPDEVTAAMLLRGQQQSQPKRVAMPRIVQQLSTGGELDPESYEFWVSHHLYPRTLSSSYKQLAPYAPQYNRSRAYGRSYSGQRFGGRNYGNSQRGRSRFGSFGPARNGGSRNGRNGGGRFGR